MKLSFAWMLMLISTVAFGQQTTIRVLGVYPNHMSVSAGEMTNHLNAIRDTWQNSGVPSSSGVTIELLNGGAAVPIHYPVISTNTDVASQEAPSYHEMRTTRAAWQADVMVLFGSFTTRCGASGTAWAEERPFTPNAQGLDLALRDQAYVEVINPSCEPYISAHEFGHLGGGGHGTTRELYPDSRAHLQYYFYSDGVIVTDYYFHTVLFDPPTDCASLCTAVGAPVWPMLQFSRNQPEYGDSGHNNVRALNTTALSLANFYEYPSTPPVLKPPVNVAGVNRGCVDGVYTRWDLYWVDHPDTTAAVTHYEVWKSQPVGQPFVYGWTVYSTFSESYVTGATARARVRACSGLTCSDLSDSYNDAVPQCTSG